MFSHDEFKKKADRMEKMIVTIWVATVFLGLCLIGFAGWVVLRLMNHFGI